MTQTAKVPDFGPEHTHIFISFTCISAVIVSLRFYTRAVISKYLGLDDWLMLCAWLVMVAYFIVSIFGFKIGLGRHSADVPFKDASGVRKYVWILEILNPIPLGFLKVSILAFYLRIMPASRLRPYYKFSIAFVVLMTIALSTALLLQCLPLRGNYQVPINVTPVKCVDGTALLFSSASLNLFTDIVILALPVPTLSKMKSTTAKKIGVLMVFMAGGLVCVASVIRLRTIFAVNTAVDKAWAGRGISFWSAMEMFVAISTSSLPAIQPLFARNLPNSLKAKLTRAKSSEWSQTSDYAMVTADENRERRRQEELGPSLA